MLDKSYEDKNEQKIEDILKSIRGIIDGNSDFISPKNNGYNEKEQLSPENYKSETENILELTSVVGDKNLNNNLISDQVKKNIQEEISRLADVVHYNKTMAKNQQLDSLVTELIRPLIKNWLDANLAKIVEKIVSEEIKKLI